VKRSYIVSLALSSVFMSLHCNNGSKDFYNSKTGIYAEKEGASVANVTQKPTGELAGTIGRSATRGQEAQENNETFSRVSSFSDPSRFIKIKTTKEIASDEIDFWARQMSEHALFFHLGFEDAQLKQEALDIHKKLEQFRTDFNESPQDMALMNTLLPLLQEERAFQIKCLKVLDEGKWIGWIFPLFINHTTLELDYLTDKLNAIKYSPEDEIVFWNRINSEHASFAAHLLDPSERELFLKADKLSMKFNKIPKSENEMMLNLSLKASKELDAFNKTARSAGKKVKSVIHPVLLDHVIREGERSIKTLKSLGLEKESAQLERQYRKQVKSYKNKGKAQ
jgi:hypothetical protein